jgi:tetratricopeptide (TPR) repeat protein
MRYVAVALVLSAILLGAKAALPQASSPQSASIIERARALVRAGAFRDAAPLLRNELARPQGGAGADHVILLSLLAQALLGEGFYDEAAETASGALSESRILHGDSAAETADVWLIVAKAEGQRARVSAFTQTALEEALKAAVAVDGPDSLRSLRAQNQVALVLSASGRSAEAEGMLRAILTKAAAIDPAPVRDQLRFTHTLGVALLRQSKFELALGELQGAYSGQVAYLSARHPETLDSLHNLGVALRRLGRLAEAEDRLQHAKLLRMEVLGADHPDTLTTRLMLVRQMIDRGTMAQAENEAATIVAALSSRLGEGHRKTIEAIGDHATALYRAGRRSEGLSQRRRAFDLATSSLGEADPETLSVGHEYGNLLYESGRHGEALQVLQRVLQGTRRLHDDQHRDTLATLHSIALVLQDLGRLSGAEESYRYILSVMDRQGRRNHPDRITVQNNLAGVLRDRRAYDEALELFREVVATRIANPTMGPEHRLTLLARSNEAATLAGLGRYDEAITIHRDVLAIRTRLLAVAHPETLRSLHNLASTLDEAGRKQEAKDEFAKVVELRRQVLGLTNLETIKSMRGFAGLLYEQGSREAARQQYRDIVSSVERIRTDGRLSDGVQREFFATVVPAYKMLAFIEADLSGFENAFAVAELSKARTMLELAATRTAVRASVLSEDERSRLAALEAEVSRLDVQIPMVADATRRADLEARRDSLTSDFRQLHAQLQQKYPKYRTATEAEIAKPDDLRSLLPSDAALLHLVNLGPRTLLIWATGSGERGTTLLSDAPNLADTVAAYRAALAKPGGVNDLRYPDPALGQPRRLIWRLADGSFLMAQPERGAIAGANLVRDTDEIRDVLSRLLFDRFPAAVRAKNRWIFSPDGPWALLPLDTLHVDGAPVVDRYEVTSVHSASMLRLLAERGREYEALQRGTMLAVGDPIYAVPQVAPPAESAAPSAPLDVVLEKTRDRATSSKVWPSLPGAAQEMAALKEMFALEPGRTLFTGVEASESQVQALNVAGDLARFRYLVFTAHGDLHNDPRLSGIVLSQIGLSDTSDGYLRAAELAAYELRTDLLVVSACDSGVGTWAAGEGILGLPFALYVAGNRGTVLTLWPIFDSSTAEFMARFFAKVKSGMSPAAALAGTKREFVRGDLGEGRKAPAYWAAFTLYGG